MVFNPDEKLGLGHTWKIVITYTQKKLVLVIEKFFSSNVVVVQKVCDRPLVSSSQRKAA